MTRAQRRRHARLWIVLGPLMLGGLLAALARRPAVPIQSSATTTTASPAEPSVEGRP